MTGRLAGDEAQRGAQGGAKGRGGGGAGAASQVVDVAGLELLDCGVLEAALRQHRPLHGDTA